MEEEHYHEQLRNINNKFNNLEKIFEKGDSCLVIQLGSAKVRFGMANYSNPKVLTLLQESQSSYMAKYEEDTESYKKIYKDLINIRADSLPRRKKTKNSSSDSTNTIKVDLTKEKEGIQGVCSFLNDLNMTEEVEFSQQSAVALFDKIINEVGLKASSLGDNDLILALKIGFNRPFVLKLIETLARRYRFNGIALTLESSLAAFSHGVQNALVVDIGDKQSSVVCVEEGVVIQSSLVTVSSGIQQVTLMLGWILKVKRGIELEAEDLEKIIYDVINTCGRFTLPPDYPKDGAWDVKISILKHEKENEIIINLFDVMVAMSLPFSKLFSTDEKSIACLVIDSLSKLSSDEIRAKYASNIILVGGLADLPGYSELFEAKMFTALAKEKLPIKEVNVVNVASRGVSRSSAIFHGGCVLPKLESYNDVLIYSQTFLGHNCETEKPELKQLNGLQYIQEKIPFQW